LLTGYYCQLGAEISQAYLSDVQPIDKNATLGGFHEAKERQSECALARASSTEDSNLGLVGEIVGGNERDSYLFARFDIKAHVMQYIWHFRLKNNGS
jgi:hypothetical protein